MRVWVDNIHTCDIQTHPLPTPGVPHRSNHSPVSDIRNLQKKIETSTHHTFRQVALHCGLVTFTLATPKFVDRPSLTVRTSKVTIQIWTPRICRQMCDCHDLNVDCRQATRTEPKRSVVLELKVNQKATNHRKKHHPELWPQRCRIHTCTCFPSDRTCVPINQGLECRFTNCRRHSRAHMERNGNLPGYGSGLQFRHRLHPLIPGRYPN